ncbi:uncharacterized protein [Trachinotus anak]|uniref:uncharacterized protein n=1 Tax=Trachinotus anak TaxID=443729 RepID=UPI0039F17E79
MAVSCLQLSICVLAYSALLLLGVSLQDAEASSCQRIFHKQAGDTVELPSCLPTEGVTSASWFYGDKIVIDMDQSVNSDPQFTGRVKLNPTNFSLTVRKLTPQDSGDFIFISEVNGQQRDSVIITLHVHEPIVKPVLNVSVTSHALNESCTVWLECISAPESKVNYNWTVRIQTHRGSSTLQYNIGPQDGPTEFTCTIWNSVIEESASTTVECSNNTSPQPKSVSSSSSLVPFFVRLIIGISVIVLLVLSLLYYTKTKDACCNRLTQSQAANQDESQQQVYSSLLHGQSSIQSSCFTAILNSYTLYPVSCFLKTPKCRLFCFFADRKPPPLSTLSFFCFFSKCRLLTAQFDSPEEETDVVPLSAEMVGGRFCCLGFFFTYSAVLLLGVCLHDAEASSCQHIFHKQAGDTVELPSCSPTEGVTSATWFYGDKIVIDMDQSVNSDPQFTGRVKLNPTNFSLTVSKLTPQDSGDFRFISEVNGQQRDTVTITLCVQEPIVKPVLNVSITPHALNESCTVWLECISAPDSKVNYNWTVRNQTHRDSSTLQYNIGPQDGPTEFTCTIWNSVIKESASTTVECSNNTSPQPKPAEPENFVLFLGVAAGAGLMIIIVVITVILVCLHKQRQAADSGANDLTVYADISDVAIEDRTSSTMKPCSVYETIDNRVNTVAPGPQTVYDKIQFNNMRKASASPYQEI